MDLQEDQDILCAVEARFPKAGPAIRKLFEAEEEFRELCGDYVECTTILKNLRRDQDVRENAERLEQYCELRVNLETELLNRISESLKKRDFNVGK